MSVLSSKPSLIEWGGIRFLIMDKPKDSNLHLYLKECKKHNVTDIVRICEPCYEAAEVEKSGIHLHVRSWRAHLLLHFNELRARGLIPPHLFHTHAIHTNRFSFSCVFCIIDCAYSYNGPLASSPHFLGTLL